MIGDHVRLKDSTYTGQIVSSWGGATTIRLPHHPGLLTVSDELIQYD